MLNEINRGQVRANLLRWISVVLEDKESVPRQLLLHEKFFSKGILMTTDNIFSD